jgi:hypothetical protein
MLLEDQFCRTEYKGQVYDSRHGGPFDRGSADSWYSRPFRPHYYEAGSYHSEPILAQHMTPAEIVAYAAGYEYNEQFGGKKSWD